MGRPEKSKPLPSKEKLMEILDYNQKTGEIVWKPRDDQPMMIPDRRNAFNAKRFNAIYAGKPAGSIRKDFYTQIMIDGDHYKAHRIAWKMVHGEEPIDIDHINGDKSDNRIENLRSVSHGENMRNKPLYANNKSGFPGVEFHVRDGVWVAKIGADNRQIHLGSFPTINEAIACRIGAQVMISYHENHGRLQSEKDH